MPHYSQFHLTSTLSNPSDKRRMRPPSGNSRVWLKGKTREGGNSIGPRPLVEETAGISLAELKQQYSRKELMAAVRDARPVRCHVNGTWQSVFLMGEPHRLPGKRNKWSDIETGTIRIWLVCLGCHGKSHKLYLHRSSLSSDGHPFLGCRKCLGLRYHSQNSWNRKWWRDMAKPLKRLICQRHRLLKGKQSPKALARLDEIEEAISIIRNRIEPKIRLRRRYAESISFCRVKRIYRNFDLLRT
jgi:hypothetical protein